MGTNGKNAGGTIPSISLEEAITEESYTWLERNAPMLLGAIINSLSDDKTPLQIRAAVSRMVGPERQGLALRCFQAAQYASGEFD